MISPLRTDVVVTGFVLAIPVFLLGLRGDLTAEEVITRLLWCLAAGWAVVAVIRFASTPPTHGRGQQDAGPTPQPSADDEPAPAA